MFEKILRDQQREIQELFSNNRIIPRQLQVPIEKGIAIIIMGVRRSGKSTYAHQLLQSCTSDNINVSDKKIKYGYINFDDERFGDLKSDGFQEILTAVHNVYGKISTILLDEPQNQQKWELFVNRLLRRNYTVLITGSNSTLLSSELSTHLTGRFLRYDLFPFSFREYLTLKQFNFHGYTDEQIGSIKNHLENYLISGGFPEIFKYQDSPRYLRDLFSSILMKDIVHRYRIHKPNDLEKLAYYFLSTPASYYTYSRLAGSLEMNKNLVATYLDYLEKAYLFFSLPIYSRRYKTQHKSPRKIYSVDLGLNAKIGFRTENNITRQIENLVFLELKQRSIMNEVPFEIYYWKSPEQYEVDFVIKSETKIIQLIQVCYKINSVKTRNREEKGLLKANQELKCDNLLLITWDEEHTVKKKEKTIKYIPLWKWLLNID
ncbi:ATP-binding protein [Candidatus Harpocratesius sp.]